METASQHNGTKGIVFFDGMCVLCNSMVNLLLKLDKKDKLLFAPLQGHTFKQHNFPNALQQIDSIVFLQEGKVYMQSTAVIRILVALGGAWKVFYIFNIFPRNWRDYVYNRISKNRYRWFGKRENCRIPSAKERNKILD